MKDLERRRADGFSVLAALLGSALDAPPRETQPQREFEAAALAIGDAYTRSRHPGQFFFAVTEDRLLYAAKGVWSTKRFGPGFVRRYVQLNELEKVWGLNTSPFADDLNAELKRRGLMQPKSVPPKIHPTSRAALSMVVSSLLENHARFDPITVRHFDAVSPHVTKEARNRGWERFKTMTLDLGIARRDEDDANVIYLFPEKAQTWADEQFNREAVL